MLIGMLGCATRLAALQPGRARMSGSAARVTRRRASPLAAARSARRAAAADADDDDDVDADAGAPLGASDDYHVPVLLSETVEWLVTDRSGVYADGTLGGGGHTAALLELLAPAGGVVVGVDRDAEALATTSGRLRDHVASGALRPVHTSFRYMPRALAALDLPALAAPPAGLTGLLLDLGVSSHQIDAGYRGFSFRHDGVLDMRMDASSAAPSARDFLNTCEPAELVRVLQDYGEEKYARPVARAILAARPHETTAGLVRAIEAVTPEPKRTKTLARVFQALRILVNDELVELEELLLAAADLVKPGVRGTRVAARALRRASQRRRGGACFQHASESERARSRGQARARAMECAQRDHATSEVESARREV
jgi:16S rRNA (cytosine1402-N4)-methyltransferase